MVTEHSRDEEQQEWLFTSCHSYKHRDCNTIMLWLHLLIILNGISFHNLGTLSFCLLCLGPRTSWLFKINRLCGVQRPMQAVSLQSIHTGIVLSVLKDKQNELSVLFSSLPLSFIPFLFTFVFFPSLFKLQCSFHIFKISRRRRCLPQVNSECLCNDVLCILLLTAHSHVKLATFPLLVIN